MKRLALAALGILAASGCTFPNVSIEAASQEGGAGDDTLLDATSPDVTTMGSDDADQGDAQAMGDAGTTDADASSAPALPDGGCDFNNSIWGTEITIDVTWMPQGLSLTSVILASGNGQIKQWVKGVRTQTGLSLSDQSVVCDIQLPDFASTALVGGETYGVRFPDTLFDDGYLPTFTVSGALSSIFPGAMYGTTTTAALLGITMTNPTSDPWPATVTTQDDRDMDGKPGVTVAVAQGTPYSDIPTAATLLPPPQRANALYLAIRQVTVASATVQTCDSMTGTVQIPQLPTPSGTGTKYAIDSHILGCKLDDGSGDCTTTGANSQAAFVDNSQPVFTPTGTPAFRSIRLPVGVTTCAAVRQMLP